MFSKLAGLVLVVYVLVGGTSAFGQAPQISVQPTSLIAVQGSSASLFVSATGLSPLSFRWQKDGLMLNDGGSISGSATSNLVFSSLQQSNAGIYTVIVTNTAGSATSSNAILTVTDPVGNVDAAYVANFSNNTVSVVARTSLGVLTSIPVGSRPTKVVASPDGQRIFVINSGAANISVISTATASVIATVPVGSQPEAIAVSSDNQRAYVVNYNSSNLTVIAISNNAVVTNISLPLPPTSIAYHPIRAELWIGYGSFPNTSMEVRSATNFSVLATLSGATHTHASAGIAFLTNGNEAFTAESCGCCGQFHRISGNHSGGNITVNQTGILEDNSGAAYVVTVNPANGQAYLGKSGHCSGGPKVYEFGSARSLSLASIPRDAAVEAARNRLWVVTLSNTVVVADTIGLTNVGTVTVGINPLGIALAPFNAFGSTPPVFSSQPQSQTVAAGSNATFNVAVTGLVLGYQWLFNGANSLAAATNASLTISNAQLINVGNYSVVVSNGFGSTTSTVASLIIPTIQIAQQGSGTISIDPPQTSYSTGQLVTLTVAPGRYYTFLQWSDGNTNNPRTISIATSNNLFIAIFTNTVPLEAVLLKQWDADFGGTNQDAPNGIAVTSDGGCVLSGESHSPASGNKTSGNFGGSDYWVVKMDVNGRKQWETNYGGGGNDVVQSIVATSDGGSLLGGWSTSGADGNKTVVTFGGGDYWVVKLDANGGKQWEMNYGGTDSDTLYSLMPAGDGGYILGGQSFSPASGNKTNTHFGNGDYWVVKVDAGGVKQWEARYGGTNSDLLTCLSPTKDGGFILGGWSQSGATGNKTSGNFGSQDYWVLKLAADGSKQWETNYGGTGNDDLRSIAPTSDGGFILGGFSGSGVSGNKTSSTAGPSDFWVVKLDATGRKQWEASYGANSSETLLSLALTTDGGCVLGGWSDPGPNGSSDYFVAKLDANGGQQWSAYYGGTNRDDLWTLAVTSEGALVMAGESGSGPSGNKTSSNFGNTDYWVVKSYPVQQPVGMPVVQVNNLYSPTNSFVFTETNAAQVTLSTTFTNGIIRYTLDGSAPTTNSPVYTGAFNLTNFSTISRMFTLTAVAWNSNITASATNDPVTVTFVTRPIFLAQTGSGTVNASPAQPSYAIGQQVALTATPGRYYTFLQWSDGVLTTNRTVTIGTNNLYTAFFTNTVPLETVVLKQWEADFGGSGDDSLGSLQQTSDGGYVLGGTSRSGASGTKTNAGFGGADYWLLKVDADGTKQWEKCFGGTTDDNLYTLQQTSDGGCILGGGSDSIISGNKTSPNYGDVDYWLVKVDANGNKQWDLSFGGNARDALRALQQTSDGGFILGGYSLAGTGGNRTNGGFGNLDYWVVKVDASGSKQWEKAFGGNLNNLLYSLQQTSDGGYIFGGASLSGASGNKTSPGMGGVDYWVVKTDAEGNKQWEGAYGGSTDDHLYGVRQTSDDGYMLGGSSDSIVSGNKTSTSFGTNDFWVVKVTSSGSKQWERSFGGDGADSLSSQQQTSDGGFIFGGASGSGVSGNKASASFGSNDFWVVKVDANGIKQGEHVFGGTGADEITSLFPTSDGGYVFGGLSVSGVSGNKTSTNYGGSDFWVIKAFLREAPVGMPAVLVNGQYSPSNSFAIPATNSVLVSLQTTFTNGYLFYTLDGSDPDFNSTFYDAPFTNAQPAVVRAIAYDSGGANPIEADPVTITIVPIYNLTNTTPGGGSVVFNPPGGLYLSNAVLTATATAANGWTFMNWSGLTAVTNNPLTLTLSNSGNLTAVFGTTIASTTNGATGASVVLWPTNGPYAFGSTVRFIGVPPAGKTFSRWFNFISGPTNSPLDYVVTTNNPVASAFFSNIAPTNFTLTTLLNGFGTVMRSPAVNFYPSNFTVQLTAVPDTDQVFVNWSGGAVGSANPLSVVLESSKIITANFGTTVQPQNQPPVVTITNPITGAVFSSPVNISVNVAASDPDGSVAQVAFHAGTNYLGARSNAPFNFTWTNAPVGTYALTAVATDNLGATATSAVVSMTVNLPPPGPAVFTLSAGTYSVQENGGSITVTIQKNFNSVASVVNYNTSPGSAVPYENGLGNYDSLAGSLSFTNGELSKTVVIQVHSTAYYVGNRTFYFSLAESGDGGTLGSPSLATITILDLDTPASTNSFPQHLSSGAPPAHNGSLRVTLMPTNAAGQWRLVRETIWRNSGDTAINLAQGNYESEFKATPGFVPPSNTTNSIIAGQLNSVTNIYGISFDTPQFGSLTLTLTPAAAVTAGAQWRVLGDGVWRNSGYTYTNILAGRTTVEFKFASGWVTPEMLSINVSPDQNNLVSANYPAPDVPFGVAPAPLPFGELSSPVVTKPYQWNGELLSDSGYGSGFVVKPRVVLTAAHVVFNDVTLSYVGNVRWFFQRYAGQYEPPTQTPRGWYVFDGYAAARTNDNSPGVSSPASQNLDVAALYLYENAGRGGYGGYLVSDGGTEWLQLPGEKTLMGYPVEGVDDTTRGQLYFTTPLSSITFTGVTNRVFKTIGLYGLPGMSGGPLCVQYTNSQFFPAAVYLGGSGQAIVRAIDGAVADLINRADATANTGNDFVGGGPVLLFYGATNFLTLANFSISLHPPEAIAAGAGWRVVQLTNSPGTYYTNNEAAYTLPVGSYTLTFHAAPGYLTPSNRALVINAGQTAALTVTYTNIVPSGLPPGLSNGVAQLAFSAPAGQRYAIERSTNLTAWVTLITNTVGSDGVLRVNDSNLTNGLQRAFYRARFVP